MLRNIDTEEAVLECISNVLKFEAKHFKMLRVEDVAIDFMLMMKVNAGHEDREPAVNKIVALLENLVNKPLNNSEIDGNTLQAVQLLNSHHNLTMFCRDHDLIGRTTLLNRQFGVLIKHACALPVMREILIRENKKFDAQIIIDALRRMQEGFAFLEKIIPAVKFLMKQWFALKYSKHIKRC